MVGGPSSQVEQGGILDQVTYRQLLDSIQEIENKNTDIKVSVWSGIGEPSPTANSFGAPSWVLY